MDDDSDVIITSGASQTVSPMAMMDIEAQLRAVCVQITDCQGELSESDYGSSHVRRDPSVPYDPFPGVRAEDLLQAVRTDGMALAGKVRTAAENYSDGEERARRAAETASAVQGTGLGLFLLFGALSGAARLLPWTLGQVSPVGAAAVMLGTRGDPAKWFSQHKRVLSDPRFVEGVRYAVSGADNTMLTSLGVPGWLVRRNDDVGTGRWGEKAGAGLIAGWSRMLTGHNKKVEVTPADSFTATQPDRLADLVERIPSPSDGEPQIRIEKYDGGAGGRPTFAVYIAGTIDSTGFGGDQVFDMRSNVAGMAELDDADSLVAVRKALREAGAQSGDSILPVGFSQGAIIASQLADDDTYNTVGTLTVGGPIAQHVFTNDAPVVRAESYQDPITGLGGVEQSPGAVGRNVTVVQGSVQEAVDAAPDDDYLPAHHTEVYANLVGRLDDTAEKNISDLREAVHSLGDGQPQVTTYAARRVERPDSRVVAPGPLGSPPPRAVPPVGDAPKEGATAF